MISLHAQHEIRHALTDLRCHFRPLWIMHRMVDQDFAFMAACAKRIEQALDNERYHDTDLRDNPTCGD